MWTMSSGDEDNDEGIEPGLIDETDPVFRSVAEADVSLDEMMSLACRQGKLDIVELLLESGAHVDYRNKAGNTPLLEACSQGHVEVARYLLDHNANIDAPTETTSDSALTWACTLGNEAIVELLLERTSDVEHRTKDGCTALMFAALAGHVKVAAMLLDHGAEINVESDSKDSPLTFACWKGHCDVVELLLERNANIEHRTKDGFTPLMFAALGGHTDVARKLLERKAEVNVPSGSNNDIPLTSACWKGHHDVVKLLLEFKSNIEHRTKDGCTPLMLAAREGHYSVAKLILDSNVPSGGENNIPLTLACWKGVPPEILARGSLALKAYKKAITEGKTFVKRVPIMLIGQDRSGKTSLKKSLRGQRFDPDEDSTLGVDVDPSHFKVSHEIWKVGEKDQEPSSDTAFSYELHAARLTVRNLSQEDNEIPRESIPAEDISQVETSASDVSNDLYSMPSASDMPDASSHDSDSSYNSENSRSFQLSYDQKPRVSDPGGSIKAIPEDVASLMTGMLVQKEEEAKSDENMYSVLWDFGGQAVYYTTHPIFLTSNAIFLLVNDLSRDPHEKAKTVVKQGMFTKLEDSYCLKTNLDYLDFWMSSVASLACQDETNSVDAKSELLPEKLPPVFLVCTHADKPHGGGDPSALAKMIFGHLQTKPYKTHLFEDVFIVDNTLSGRESECTEVVRLRGEVLAVAEELPLAKQAIPIKWLKFEKEIQAKKEEGNRWIFLESAKEIACDICNVVDDEEFRTLLNFLHDQRILIHFDDTPELNKLVVLDVQWLIDVFKEVITIRPYQRKEKKFKELWCKLERDGILEETLLEHVWGPLYVNETTCESLIAIMEKFSLLCPWPSSDGSRSRQYLVPSMLMSHPPEDIMELLASVQIPSLFLKFESCQVPPGLFPRLVLQLLQWCKQECESPGHPQLYHNFARIYNSTEENCSVILLCHMSFIEVVVLRCSSSHEVEQSSKSQLTSPLDDTYDTFVCAVVRQLELMLESMRREYCWLQNMKYEVHFLCPVCCQGGAVTGYCRTHRLKGCKQEECLHFLSESELCSGKKTICCTKSAVAKISSVSVKRFELWLAPMSKQLTFVENDDRNVASVEATTEVSLPDNVQQSLLSPSCDAKEVVIQLKENRQLDQAALERPDPDTKTIIRSLARKAKDAKRMDVFQHLREITPAGTTGPLLPENLPVLNIPVSKARELTIHLAGGDEWKELAEGLGLTPSEIRFLDHRTMNPMDAALTFIAKQRYVSVAELYALLNEHGFPMLADLL